jgi:cytochrome c1
MRRRIVLAIACVFATAAATIGCDRNSQSATEQYATNLTDGGVPSQGREKIMVYGCSGCHTIPGIPDADAMIAPPLTKMANRSYVGGVVKNTPRNLIQWIQNPPAIDDKTAMPNLHVTEADARDIASYLYTLR